MRLNQLSKYTPNQLNHIKYISHSDFRKDSPLPILPTEQRGELEKETHP